MIALYFRPDIGECDIRFENEAIVSSPEHDLETAALLSIHTDLRVEASEVPTGVGRGGSWMDSFVDLVVGSRLWILPITPSRDDNELFERAQQSARDAFAWGIVVFFDDVLVTASRLTPKALSIVIVIVCGDECREFFAQMEVG